MVRYCTNCNTGTDFPIKSMTDLDNLICPKCGSKVDKNSRSPENKTEEPDQAAEIAGGFFYLLYKIRYYFFFVVALIGIGAYFLKIYKLMFVVTVINLAIFYIRLLFYRFGGLFGFVFIPLGAFLGYTLAGGDINGICLGVLIVFAIRHMFKAFLARLFGKLIQVGNQK